MIQLRLQSCKNDKVTELLVKWANPNCHPHAWVITKQCLSCLCPQQQWWWQSHTCETTLSAEVTQTVVSALSPEEEVTGLQWGQKTDVVLPSAAPSQGVGKGTPRAEGPVSYCCDKMLNKSQNAWQVYFGSVQECWVHGWQEHGVAGHSATTVRKLRERGADAQLPRWCCPHLG